MRVKQEQTEWEKKRKEERRLKAQRELEEKKKQQKELEKQKKQKEEEAKKAEELANKQKLIDEENEKKAKEEAKLKLKFSKNKQEEEKENCGSTETKVVDMAEGRNEKKKSANLDDEILDDSFEVVPSALNDSHNGQKKGEHSKPSKQIASPTNVSLQNHKNYVDVLIEIGNARGKGKPADNVFIKGSWDKWDGKIPMKYSQYSNSFLAVLSLPISKDDYEFLHSNQERGWLFDYKYPNRHPPQTINKIWGVNFIKMNSATQIGNQNSSWKENKDLLEKILVVDTFIASLVNDMKNSQKLDFSAQQINKITQKYREIRKAISTKLQINSQEVKQLIDEADLAVTYLEMIFFVRYDWAKFEDGNSAVKKSEMATKIRAEFMKKLLQFTMSKEEAIHQFKYTFCYSLLTECRRIGLEHGVSEEIQQLKTFIDANFLHNLPTGSPV